MSCLFNSLSYFIKKDSYSVRQEICNYLEENKKIIDGLDTKYILNLENPNYIQNMRQTSTWGGAIEIQTACNIWKYRIIVKNLRGTNNSTIEFLPITCDFLNTIEIEWTGGHYEPVRR